MGQEWPELILKYGPYAVLALFAIWVAPRQTKIFLDSQSKEPAKVILSAGIAAFCWVIVAGMSWYVYDNWPPRKTYLGMLGYHGDAVTFVSLEDRLLMSGTLRGQLLAWRYAVVDDNSGATEDQEFHFAYVWGPEPNDFTEYALTKKGLKAGPVNFSADKNDVTHLLYDDDRDSNTPPVPYPKVASNFRLDPTQKGGLFSAWAQAAPSQPDAATINSILRYLDSPNRTVQIQALRRLRGISSPRLENLLHGRGLSPRARTQISRELTRRQTGQR